MRYIHFIQNLSLDITAGAVIMTLFLAEIYGVDLTIYMVFGLAIAIWLIYTADHLFDAYKLKVQATNPRHAFHQKNFRLLIGISLVVFSLGLYNLQFLPEETIWIGSALALLSGAYLYHSYASAGRFKKEIFAAFVYTAGIATAPLSLLPTYNWADALILVQIFLLAFSNLMVIPLFEREVDKQDQQDSIALKKGQIRLSNQVKGIMLIHSSLCVCQVFLLQADPFSQLIMFFMGTVIYVLVQSQHLFQQYQLYRILADGIFFLPGIYLLV